MQDWEQSTEWEYKAPAVWSVASVLCAKVGGVHGGDTGGSRVWGVCWQRGGDQYNGRCSPILNCRITVEKFLFEWLHGENYEICFDKFLFWIKISCLSNNGTCNPNKVGLILSFQIAQSCITYPIFNVDMVHFPLQKNLYWKYQIQSPIFNNENWYEAAFLI